MMFDSAYHHLPVYDEKKQERMCFNFDFYSYVKKGGEMGNLGHVFVLFDGLYQEGGNGKMQFIPLFLLENSTLVCVVTAR